MNALWFSFLFGISSFCSDSKLHPEACNTTGTALGHQIRMKEYSDKLDDYFKNMPILKEPTLVYTGTVGYFLITGKGKLTVYRKDNLSFTFQADRKTDSFSLGTTLIFF